MKKKNFTNKNIPKFFKSKKFFFKKMRAIQQIILQAKKVFAKIFLEKSL